MPKAVMFGVRHDTSVYLFDRNLYRLPSWHTQQQNSQPVYLHDISCNSDSAQLELTQPDLPHLAHTLHTISCYTKPGSCLWKCQPCTNVSSMFVDICITATCCRLCLCLIFRR